MKRYDLITPEGTKDLLFDECLARREVEKTHRKIFSGLGYSEVVTPGIEFYDLFNNGARCFPQENLYKLVDSKGRLITLRPDSTIPIARMVATRLKDKKLPIRLFYNQSIFSINPLLAGRSDEIVQSGIELIGCDSKRADLEVLSIAIKALSAFDSNHFRLEIGHMGFFKQLVEKLNVDERICEEIRYNIESKNYPALNDLLDSIGDNKVTRALKQLPRLFGGEEVFDKASTLFSDEKMDKTLSNLKDVYKNLSYLGYNGKITVDLGIVNRTYYYTGIVFRGYMEGCGEPVLAGGRYDNLIKEFGRDIPATGFAVNVDSVANILKKSGLDYCKKNVECIIFAEKGYEMKALMLTDKYLQRNVIVENSIFDSLEDTKKYATENGIQKIVIVSETEKTIKLEGGAFNE